MECQYCKKTYVSTSSLNKHIKTNKKCISVRTNVDISTVGILCVGCDKLYSSEYLLNNHKKECMALKRLDDIYFIQTRVNELENTNKVLSHDLNIKTNEIENYKNIINQIVVQLEQKDKTIEKITKNNQDHK